MTEQELKKLFEEEYLKKMTCFDSFDELMKDKTNIEINAPRACIALCAKGHWDGMVFMNNKIGKRLDKSDAIDNKFIEDLSKIPKDTGN